MLSVDPGHIRWEPSGVRLVPRAVFIAKNQSSSSHLVEIFLAFLFLFFFCGRRQGLVPGSSSQVVSGSCEVQENCVFSVRDLFCAFLRLLLDPQSLVGLSNASGKQGLMPFSPIEYMHMILGRLVLLGHCSMGQH